MNTNVKLEKVREATDMTQLTETQKINITTEISKFNFWADKQPCWEKCHCPEIIKAECPATKYRFLPCWEIEGTYCKLDDRGATGNDTSICEVCRVYKKYSDGEPIKLKLIGKGMNSKLSEIENTIKI
jgi:hypothetical protein